MRMVAGGLMAHGHDVRLPAEEDSRRLSIEQVARRCVLWVDDTGAIEMIFVPTASTRADPKRMADVATVLLASRGADYPRLGSGYGQPGITLKGTVALELKARGFDVDLEIYEDDDRYNAFAIIVATNPAAAMKANVRIGDDGAIVWENEYETADSGMPEVEGADVVAHPAEVAGSIVTTVAQAISMYPAVSADSP